VYTNFFIYNVFGLLHLEWSHILPRPITAIALNPFTINELKTNILLAAMMHWKHYLAHIRSSMLKVIPRLHPIFNMITFKNGQLLWINGHFELIDQIKAQNYLEESPDVILPLFLTTFFDKEALLIFKNWDIGVLHFSIGPLITCQVQSDVSNFVSLLRPCIKNTFQMQSKNCLCTYFLGSTEICFLHMHSFNMIDHVHFKLQTFMQSFHYIPSF
ncbi:hypothetical protein ACJX0J_016209, partial [Zea mays]